MTRFTLLTVVVCLALPGCTRLNPGFGVDSGDDAGDENGDGDGESETGNDDGEGEGETGPDDTGQTAPTDTGPGGYDIPPGDGDGDGDGDEPYCETFFLHPSADTFFQGAPQEGESCQLGWNLFAQGLSCQHLNFGIIPWHWVGGGNQGYYAVKWDRAPINNAFAYVEFAALHVQVYNPEGLPGTLQVRPFMPGPTAKWYEGNSWAEVPAENDMASTYKYRDFGQGDIWDQYDPLISTETFVGLIELENISGLEETEVELDDIRMTQWLGNPNANGFLIGGEAQIFDTQITSREGPAFDPQDSVAPVLEVSLCTE